MRDNLRRDPARRDFLTQGAGVHQEPIDVLGLRVRSYSIRAVEACPTLGYGVLVRRSCTLTPAFRWRND